MMFRPSFKNIYIGLLMLALPSMGIGANKNVGTSGAQFLRIGAGARPTAMGEAFVGIADDVNSVYFNPAGLAFIKTPELAAMHTQYFLDTNYEFGAFAYPSPYGSFGVSAATLKVEDHQRRGLDESPTGTFDATDAAYGLSYAKLLHRMMSVGGTIRFINQKIDTASANTWSADIGSLYKFGSLPLSVGLAIRHFGQDVKFNEESDPLPTTIDLGFGANLLKDKLIMGLDFRRPRDNDIQIGLGGEWNQPLGHDFKASGRAGYNSATTDPDDTTGISLGGGLGYKTFDLNFAWVPFGDLGDTFRYSALLRF